MRFIEARQRAGLGVSKLARISGVSRHTVYCLQNGERPPQYGTALRLARALGVNPADVDEFRQVVEDLEAVAG